MKLPKPTCQQVKALLEALGFEPVKRTGTSHEKYKHPNYRGRGRSVTVDCPKAPFDVTLIHFMAMQAGLTKKEFWEAAVGRRCPTTLLSST